MRMKNRWTSNDDIVCGPVSLVRAIDVQIYQCWKTILILRPRRIVPSVPRWDQIVEGGLFNKNTPRVDLTVQRSGYKIERTTK